MHRALRIALPHVLTAIVSVLITIFVVSRYYFRPIVVVDLDSISGYVQEKGLKLEKDQAVEYVGNFYDWMARDIRNRREIVLQKKAIVNAEQVKDITDEYKR